MLFFAPLTRGGGGGGLYLVGVNCFCTTDTGRGGLYLVGVNCFCTTDTGRGGGGGGYIWLGLIVFAPLTLYLVGVNCFCTTDTGGGGGGGGCIWLRLFASAPLTRQAGCGARKPGLQNLLSTQQPVLSYRVSSSQQTGLGVE